MDDVFSPLIVYHRMCVSNG